MNILILGSGGREHAIAWKVAKSNRIKNLFVAPGNAGTVGIAINVNINPMDFNSVAKFITEKNIDMLIVGPEEPLVKGIAEFMHKISGLENLKIIGPDSIGAKLEGSKEFAKEFMQKYDIPTASYKAFNKDGIQRAFDYLDKLKPPYVLKADGLAAGKGVVILEDKELAKEALKKMFDGQFGEAGNTVVIEEFLDGIEYSVFVLTDGENYCILPEAKDYKRIGEANTGLNTGGMGAISPVPFFDKKLREKTERQIILPTINGLKNEGINYRGFIFFGLIMVNNNPFVIEYNVRLGDPETEAIIPRVKNDLIDLFEACAASKLNNHKIDIINQTVASVMAVSGGYPESYEKGKQITGLNNITDSILFHAGTKMQDGRTVTSGGRVIAVSSYGKTMQEALKKSYQSLDKINFDKMFFRKDLGFDLQ